MEDLTVFPLHQLKQHFLQCFIILQPLRYLTLLRLTLIAIVPIPGISILGERDLPIALTNLSLFLNVESFSKLFDSLVQLVAEFAHLVSELFTLGAGDAPPGHRSLTPGDGGLCLFTG
jgi:hypothetical protein